MSQTQTYILHIDNTAAKFNFVLPGNFVPLGGFFVLLIFLWFLSGRAIYQNLYAGRCFHFLILNIISSRSQMKIHLKFTLNFKRRPTMTVRHNIFCLLPLKCFDNPTPALSRTHARTTNKSHRGYIHLYVTQTANSIKIYRFQGAIT